MGPSIPSRRTSFSAMMPMDGRLMRLMGMTWRSLRRLSLPLRPATTGSPSSSSATPSLARAWRRLREPMPPTVRPAYLMLTRPGPVSAFRRRSGTSQTAPATSSRGSTFLVFVDYFRPTIRVASLAELDRVSYILTHDSIGVGEDGPTHQPVETVSGLRVIPNLDVFRPGDAEETVAAYVSSVTRSGGPTALILSRQNMAQNNDMPALERREGALKGAYVAKKESGDLDLIILATGSELQHALEAAKDMPVARVVSMPCMELFERQTDDYKESVLPSTCTKRIAMEAGVSAPWYKYASKVVGVDRFGFSAPGDIVMGKYGMTAENLAAEIATMN